MIPHKLTLQNFLSYQSPPEPLDFSHMHLAVLIGANGHGKSALLDAMTWALWGKARARNDELVHLGAGEMMVHFEFLLEGQRYAVTRKYIRSSGKTSLELGIWDEAGSRWQPLTESGVRATQARIDSLLRMDYDTFLHTAFLRQGEADAFTTAMPAKRKEILGKVLNLARYDQYARRARELGKAVQQEVDRLAGQLQSLEEELAQEDRYRQEVQRAEVAELQARLAMKETIQQEAEARRALDALKEKDAAYQKLKERLDQALRDHEQTHQALNRQRQRVETLQALVQQRATIETQYRAWEQARVEEERWSQVLTRLRPLEVQRQELEQHLNQARHQLETQLAVITRQLEEAERAEAALPQLTEKVARLREEIAKVDAVAQEDQEHRQQLAALEVELQSLRRELSRYLQVLKARPELEAKRAQLAREVADLEVLQQEEQARQQRLSELRVLIHQKEEEKQRILEEGEDLKERQTMLKKGATDVCPVCHRPLGEEDREHVWQEYERELASLREQYHALQQEIQALKQEEATLQKASQDAQFRLQRLVGLQRQLAQLEQRLQEDEEGDIPLEERVKALQAELESLEARRQTLLQAQQVAQPLLADSPGLRRQLGTLEHALSEAQAKAQQAESLRAQAAQLRSQLDAGPDPQIQAQLQAVEAEIARLAYDATAHLQARKQLEALQQAPTRWAQVQEAEQVLPQEQASLAQLEARWQREEQRLAEDQAELARLEQELQALSQAQRTWEQARRAAEEAHRAWEQAHGRLAATQQRLASLEGVRARYKELKKEIAQTRDQRRRYALLEEAFGRKGLQAMLIEAALPELENEANRLLARLSDGRMHVRLQTQREKRSGGVQEVLDIIIADELGSRPYELYSGGEAFRVDLSLRIALSRLLARRAGAALQALFIDEGFGTQDAQGRESLVDALHMIQDEFALILVITHIDELKDHFPVRILVEKTPQGSVYRVS